MQESFGNQQFARGNAGQGGVEISLAQGLGQEVAGRHIDPGHAEATGRFRRGSQVIVSPRLQERVFGQRSRRHHPRHLAPDNRLGAPFLGFRRVFGLLTHCDLETFADQAGQIHLRRVHGHASHGDVFALMFAAFRQRDIQRFSGAFGVLKEQLVEVAHAVEQHAVGIVCLDLEELLHHGGNAGFTRGACPFVFGRVRHARTFSVTLCRVSPQLRATFHFINKLPVNCPISIVSRFMP